MSLMTDIAALIREKFNAQKTLIDGKAPIGHTHRQSDITGGIDPGIINGLSGRSNQYVGTDAHGVPATYPLPSGTGGPVVMGGSQTADGSRIIGSTGINWTHLSTGKYQIPLADLGLTSVLHGVYYELNNGSFVVSSKFIVQIQFQVSATMLEVNVMDAAGNTWADSPFSWIAIRF